ncbi:adenylate/guanylate cyclase domain-containing protein [Hoeflea sp. TYP-13]|uniref:adenylate/guanylate cyclase domain-containing protein n=1 Tax=Hoeflea sp. TYP-13 TaxID=3230023 RepID=UPI0034C65A9E
MDHCGSEHHSSPMSHSTIAFVDLAGFSAIADVFGDALAIDILDRFEELVRASLGEEGNLVKWIGDEVLLEFPGPDAALRVLGRLLPACRSEKRIPLTRSGINHGPVIRRTNDVFGSTVNIASRITSLAAPGQLLATQSVADPAAARGIALEALGPHSLRSVADKVQLFEIKLTPSVDPAWIDPVCKMYAPQSVDRKESLKEHWFCSSGCKKAFRKSPETYPIRVKQQKSL